MYSCEYCKIFKNSYLEEHLRTATCMWWVCVFILFHREGVFRLQDIWDILGRYWRTMLCWVSFQVLLPSSFISVSKNVIYITSKDKNSSEHKLERKQYDIWFRKKIIYIDIGYKSAAQLTDKWGGKTKDEEATLIIQIFPLELNWVFELNHFI